MPNVRTQKICSARCEWPLAAGWTNSLLCQSVARRCLVREKCWVKSDKFGVKLKRHSSSYERDQGEQPRKVFIDRGVRTVGLPRHLLQIQATLPVSTSTAERGFGTLRRQKTYMRTTLETASLAWLLWHGIQSASSTRRKFLDLFASESRRSDFGIKLDLAVWLRWQWFCS